MNSYINPSNDSEVISTIATAKNLLENYEIHIVSVIGVLFNFHSLFIIKNYIPNFKFYDFFLCRCVCNLVVCFFGIFFKLALIESIICEECMRPSYLQLYLQVYFVCIPLRIAFLSSAVSDILLIMNRVALLYYRHLSAFYTLSVRVFNYIYQFYCGLSNFSLHFLLCYKANLLICFAFPIILISLGYFAFEIANSSNSTNESTRYLTLNEFGKTKLYRVYMNLSVLVETLIPVVALLTLNAISLIRFKKLMTHLGPNRSFKIQTFRLIIMLTFISLITRTFDLAVSVAIRLRVFYKTNVNINTEIDAVLLLMRTVSFFLLFAAHALDGLFYYVYDRTLKSVTFPKIKSRCYFHLIY